MTRFSSSIRRDEIEIIWPISFRIYGLVGLIDYTVGVVGVRISLFDNDFVNEHDEEDGAAKERTKTKKNVKKQPHKIVVSWPQKTGRKIFPLSECLSF